MKAKYNKSIKSAMCYLVGILLGLGGIIAIHYYFAAAPEKVKAEKKHDWDWLYSEGAKLTPAEKLQVEAITKHLIERYETCKPKIIAMIQSYAESNGQPFTSDELSKYVYGFKPLIEKVTALTDDQKKAILRDFAPSAYLWTRITKDDATKYNTVEDFVNFEISVPISWWLYLLPYRDWVAEKSAEKVVTEVRDNKSLRSNMNQEAERLFDDAMSKL